MLCNERVFLSQNTKSIKICARIFMQGNAPSYSYSNAPLSAFVY